MRLVADARKIITRAWSVRFAALGAVLSAGEAMQAVLPQIADFVPPRVFAALSLACGVCSIVSRVVAQPAMHDEAK